MKKARCYALVCVNEYVGIIVKGDELGMGPEKSISGDVPPKFCPR
jgi:hypothetical protein